MSELEYEVVFVIGSVNVITVAYLDEGDFSDNVKLEEVAIRRAADAVYRDTGFDVGNADEITATHTSCIMGG